MSWKIKLNEQQQKYLNIDAKLLFEFKDSYFILKEFNFVCIKHNL